MLNQHIFLPLVEISNSDMRKFTFLLLMLVAFSSRAQQFRYGFSIALGSNKLVLPADMYDPAVSFSGFQYGLLLDQTFVKGDIIGVSLGLNLNYSQSGMTSTDNNGAGDDKEWAVRARYLEIPLTLKLRTPQFGSFTIYGEGGATYGKCLRAVGDYTLNGLTLDSDIDYLEKDNANGINYLDKNAGLQFGLGAEVEVAEGASIIIGFFYQKGIMNVYEDNNVGSDILLNQTGIRIAGLF